MNIDRRKLLKLLPASGVAILTGCDDSDEQRVARVQRQIQTQQQAPLQPVQAPVNELTPEEKAANDPSKKLILFCAASLTDPWAQLQSTLMQTAVRQLDGYRFKAVDASGDAGLQLTQLSSAQQERPAFLLVSVIDEHLCVDAINAIRHNGGFVIGLDERLVGSPGCNTVAFVSQKKMGQEAGRLVVEALKRKAADENRPQVTGRVVHLTGDTGSFIAAARSEGFREALMAEPGIIIVHEASAAWTRENATARTQDALRLQHEFDVVCAHNDAMAQGASEALNTAQMRDRVLVTGMDGGLDLVRKGVIDATIYQPMPMQAAFDIIKKVAADSHYQPPVSAELQPEPVTPVNLDEAIRKLLRQL